MVEGTGRERRAGMTTLRRPGLIRSIAHRLAGEHLALPVEGRLAGFDGATRWLNSEPLTPQGLRGRVVLVDFWTYTCVNWLRALPYRRAWAAKYADAGLTVVGVHTPEFGFEHDLDNVSAQTRDLGVGYPVAVDNDYTVWRAFDNHFWPALYLADVEGRVRYHHFGEGEYAMIEMVVQQLLLEAGADDLDQDLVVVEPRGLEVAADWPTLGSPETYLGYARAQRRGDGLTGDWRVGEEFVELEQPGGSISYRFTARDVNLVLAPGAQPARFAVRIDGEPPGDDHGLDSNAAGEGVVTEPRMHQLVRQAAGFGDRAFEITFHDAGVRAYVFTFG
jgi:thiol-disulfide isomerase/thioredoxin